MGSIFLRIIYSVFFRIYGRGLNDKILIPPSIVLIYIASKWGWQEEDIIKINLPRWDRYSNIEY